MDPLTTKCLHDFHILVEYAMFFGDVYDRLLQKSGQSANEDVGRVVRPPYSELTQLFYMPTPPQQEARPQLLSTSFAYGQT